MGCGTGKQLTANHHRFPDVQMIGLDLFHGMLEQARRRSKDIQWMEGDSAAPPFTMNSFDYITNQFSYHHVQDKNRMITSVFRILKPNGRFVITNLDPWSMPKWIVYMYFPTSRERDLCDFLPVEELTTLMQNTGFCDVRMKYSHKRSEEKLSDFLAYASQRHRTSQLMAISDQDYEAGIAKLRASIASMGIDSYVASEMSLVRIVGNKPR
jgi:SAM-dependent methyltransferase